MLGAWTHFLCTPCLRPRRRGVVVLPPAVFTVVCYAVGVNKMAENVSASAELEQHGGGGERQAVRSAHGSRYV